VIIISSLISACTHKDSTKNQQNEFIESINNFDEVYFGLITSYTSGFISENQDLQISFNSDIKLKKVFGEVIHSRVFNINPKIKGEVYWVDEHTIGYKFAEKPQADKVYKCKFNLKEFIDSPTNLPDFTFDFIVKAQDFKVSEAFYLASDTDTCTLSFELQFVNSVTIQDAIKLIDSNVQKKYSCYAEQIGSKRVKITVPNIVRADREYAFTINFNGEPMNINSKEEKKYTIPAKSEFKYLNHSAKSGTKTLTVEFSNPLHPNSNINGLIYISQTASYKTQINDNLLSIVFDNINDLANEEIYLYVDENLKDINSKKLNDDLSLSFVFTDSNLPSINWLDDGYIVPDKSGATMFFEAANLHSVILRIVKIYDNNVLDFLQDNNFSDTYYIRNVGRLERKVKLALSADDYSQKKVYSIRIADYVDVIPGDLFQISLDYDMTCYAVDCDNEIVGKTYYDDKYWDNEYYDYKSYYYGPNWWQEEKDPCSRSFYNYVEIKKNILVSDIAVTVKYATDELVNVFVRGINNAEPVANCDVLLYNFQKQVIGQAQTDMEGKCKIKPESVPYFVEVRDGKTSKAYIKLDKNQSLSLSNFDVSGNLVKSNINGFIYSNRDVWRPGDSVNINFIISDIHNTVPKNFPVILEVFDSQGRLVLKRVNNSTVGNIYSFAFATVPSDPTGLWSAYIHLGNQSFHKGLRIETVKPNRLKVDLNLPKTISLNRVPKVKLNSAWLNGLPASNLSASVDVKVSSITTSFNDFPGYSFNNVSADFIPTEVNLVSSLKLNDKGNADINLENLSKLSLPGFSKAVFITKVFEGNGDFSISSTSSVLSPFKRYVGVKLPEPQSKYWSYYYTDQDWTFDVVLVNEDGKIDDENADLSLSVYKLDYYWWWDNDYENLSKYVNGTYKRPVKGDVISMKNGKSKFVLNFADKDWGTYLIVINDYKGGHVFSEVVNFDYPYYDRNKNISDAPAILSLKTDKDTYQVGETINLTFPANKEAKALVCIEGSSTVIESFNVSDLKEDALVKIVATEAMLPNVYINVILFQPYTSGNDLPIRLYGIVPVKVEDPATKLQPVISMPKETQSKTNIDITVSETSGKPMYYTLALVDEGILGITSYKTPDPHKYIFSKQALRINTWDNYSGIIDAYEGEMNSVFAVGGDMEFNDMETALSKRFQAVAFSYGPFELKAKAKDKHSIEIPEYIGSLRAMVIASNDKNAYGSTQENIIVKDPIMIMPTAPKIVSPNDEFIVPIQVIAPDMIGKNINISLSTNKLNIIGKNSMSVTTNSNGEATVEFTLRVPKVSGNAELIINASAGNVGAESKITIPIRMPFSLKQTVVMEKVNPKSTKTIDLSFNGIDGTTGGQVTLNTLIPLDLFSHLDFLIGYPHGCLEQTVSKAFPQLYLDYFITFDDAKQKEIKLNVEAAISKLKNYLRNDNSMTNWMGGSYVVPWTEIYASHFLIEAKNRGYNVPDDMLSGIMKYHANKAKAWNYNVDYPTSDVYQAYRLFILALNNTPETGAMNRFKEQENLQQLSKVILSATYALSGKTKIAQDIFAEVKLEPNKMMSDWYISYGSFSRDFAFYIYAEMLINADEEIVRQDILSLAGEFGKNQWMSTQTAAFNLFVLGKYAEKHNLTKSDLVANLTIDNKNYQINTNRSSIVFDFVPNEDSKIEVENLSNDMIYASVYAKGYVAEYDTIESGAYINMSVNYYDKSGQLINPKSLAKNTEFYAEITVENNDKRYRITDNALTYLLPGGWEIVNNRMFDDYYDQNIRFIDIRDDRAYYYFDLMPGAKLKFRISLVAVHSGKYTVPQVRCDDMYNNEIFYVIPARNIEVK
jgi:uncharacterized protein YfaS (alpha-2-macroglobulin family)